MTTSNDLQNLIEFYKAVVKVANREPIPDLFKEDGKLRQINLPCPMCSSEEDDNERTHFGENMYFNFAEHTLGCNDCEAEFTADDILAELKAKAAIFVENVEGFALLLPRLEMKKE